MPLKPGEAQVWRVRLDALRKGSLARPTPGEQARAARFHSAEVRKRYLRAHGALRTILGRLTHARLEFAVTERGKPYLPAAPELRFSLSRSHGMALVAAALEVDVGVDVERVRPLPEYAAVADRFFPPSESAALAEAPPEAREREFFRRWTRIEAMLKATGAGMYGAGTELGGPWTVREIDVGEEFAAAVAAAREGIDVVLHDFGDEDGTGDR
jgi:4'-phosphopantetheinyl transferase